MKLKIKTIIAAVFVTVPLMLLLFSCINFRILRVDNRYYSSFKGELMTATGREHLLI